MERPGTDRPGSHRRKRSSRSSSVRNSLTSGIGGGAGSAAAVDGSHYFSSDDEADDGIDNRGGGGSLVLERSPSSLSERPPLFDVEDSRRSDLDSSARNKDHPRGARGRRSLALWNSRMKCLFFQQQRQQKASSSPPPPPPGLSWFPPTCCCSMRWAVLVVLCLQNSMFTVLRRYSQGVLRETYSKYECLLVGEIIKIVFSAWMIRSQMRAATANDSSSSSTVTNAPLIPLASSSSQDSSSDVNEHTFRQRLLYLLRTSRKMFALAGMYGAMNILSFVALRNISAGLFTIIAQTKVFTTAVFSSLILQRRYTATQWRALVALVLGVLLFTEPVWNSSKFTGTSLTQGGGDASQEHQLWKQDHQRPWLGTMAVMMEVTMSGFASIYFEKVIKIDPLQLSIWERNFQLALGSVPVYLLFILQENVGGTTQSGHGPGSGWTPLAVVVAALGAAGGLLVALSIKYGDSILKTLATTGAIILSSVLDHVWLRGPLTPTMMIAGCQVIFAICNYTFDATPPVSPAAAKAAAAVTSPLAMEAAKKDTTDQIASQPDEEMVPLMLRPAPSSESTGMSKRQATKAEMSDDS